MLAFRVVKDSFKLLYENLFKFMIFNIIWFGLLTIPVYILYFAPNNIVFILGVIYILIIFGPLFLSGLDNISKVLTREDPGYMDFFKGIKINFKRGLFAFLFTAFIYVILGLDFLFFLQRSGSWFFLVIGVFTFYAFFVFSMMQIYFWGLLNRNREDRLWAIIKKSFFLTVDNVISNLILLILMLIITVVSIVLAVVLPVFFFSLISLLIIIGTGYTLDKYSEKDVDSDKKEAFNRLMKQDKGDNNKDRED